MAVAKPIVERPAGNGPLAREDHHAVLDAFVADLRETFADRVNIEPATLPEGSSMALTLRVDDQDFATFGAVDATYYWTFDGGASCHYAKDKEVMKRFLRFELNAAIAGADRTT